MKLGMMGMQVKLMHGLKCQLFTAVTCKIPDFIEKLDTNDVCWYLIERHKMLKISKVLNCIIIHISVKCHLYESLQAFQT